MSHPVDDAYEAAMAAKEAAQAAADAEHDDHVERVQKNADREVAADVMLRIIANQHDFDGAYLDLRLDEFVIDGHVPINDAEAAALRRLGVTSI